MSAAAELTQRLRAFMVAGEGAFEALALELFAWQRAHNPAYAAFCGGAEPASWQEIPAVPVPLFQDLPLTSFPVDEARVVFRTSGTSAGRRGAKHLRDTELYDLGARLHAEARLGPLPRSGVSLVPTAPDSSLGHMCAAFVPGMSSFFSAEAGVDVAGAWAALRSASEPLFLPGTAFALAALVAGASGPVRLPEGSLLMVTGGFKGRRVDLDEHGLLRALARLLPGTRLVGEYGMTELSSQLWAVPAGSPYRPPPWLRVLAVEPGSGRPLPPGEAGQLRFFDLANHQTVLAIETLDQGLCLAGGGVRLLGRLPRAALRGCSLRVEEAGP